MRTKFTRLNFETECAWDCITGRGFLIKEPPFSDADKSIRNMDGPRSPRYGTSWNDVDAFNDRYHCQCGNLVGATFEGEICKKCGTEVEYTEVDPKITGWLNFYPYRIINPLAYHRLQSALSKKVLEGIISNDNIITPEGHIRSHEDEMEVKKTMMKYFNIGIKAFYENYEEIMTYYMGKRKQKAELIQRLIDDKDIVWTSKIPVYSTILRPQSITTESYYFSPPDRQIVPLTMISINLKTAAPIEVTLYLYQAQTRVNTLWDLAFSVIEGKKGWTRSQVLGGEFNYSGRAVIILDVTLKLDEIDIPYKMFLTEYRGQIIKRIKQDKGWTTTKAANFLSSKFMYDPYVYSVMQRIVEEIGPHVILNRNPTITYGSILKMKIRKVKRDPDDLCISLPSAILPGLNADDVNVR